MKKLLFDSMNAAIMLTFNKLKMSSLMKKSAEYYLQTEGINSNITEK